MAHALFYIWLQVVCANNHRGKKLGLERALAQGDGTIRFAALGLGPSSSADFRLEQKVSTRPF